MAININTRYGSDIISQSLNEKVSMVFGENGILSGFSVSEYSKSKAVVIEKGQALINGAIITSDEQVIIPLSTLVSSAYKWKILLEYRHEDRVIRFVRVVPSSLTQRTANDILEAGITKNMVEICTVTGLRGNLKITVPDKLSTLEYLTNEISKIPNTTDIATPENPGLMSPEDKEKLDGIETEANKYIHPESHPASIITTTSTLNFASDAEKQIWNNAIATTDYSVDIMLNSTSNVLEITRSGKYIGYNCINAPSEGYMLYDVDYYVDPTNGQSYKVITASYVDKPGSFTRFKYNDTWSSWTIVYDSKTHIHNHNSLYFTKKEFADLTDFGATWDPGTVYDNVFSLPNGIMMQWGDVGGYPNDIHNGEGYYSRTVNLHTPFKKRYSIFLRQSPAPGSKENAGNGIPISEGGTGVYWGFKVPFILSKDLTKFRFVLNGGAGCLLNNKYVGMGLGMEWFAIGV